MQALTAKHEAPPNQVGLWKKQAVEGLAAVFAAGRETDADEALVKERHAKVGNGLQAALTMERDFSGAGWGAEPHGASGDRGAWRRVESGPAMRAAGGRSGVAVPGTGGQERIELGADAVHRRAVLWSGRCTAAGRWRGTCGARGRPRAAFLLPLGASRLLIACEPAADAKGHRAGPQCARPPDAGQSGTSFVGRDWRLTLRTPAYNLHGSRDPGSGRKPVRCRHDWQPVRPRG